MEKKEKLIVGVDDSNHAGDDRIKGEIDFGIFSFHQRDSEVKEFPNRRNYLSFEDWMNVEGRDYRFVILKSPKYHSSDKNLIISTPLLIEKYLDETRYLVKSIEVNLDGVLRTHERAQLIYTIQKRTGVKEVVATGFVKKKGLNKYLCPEVVYRADTGANMFFGKKFEELVSDKKLVDIL